MNNFSTHYFDTLMYMYLRVVVIYNRCSNIAMIYILATSRDVFDDSFPEICDIDLFLYQNQT